METMQHDVREAETQPRLEPIDEPDSWLLKGAYWMTEHQMGKVITPLKVINARIPKSLRLSYEMNRVEEKGLSLDDELKFLIKSYVATLNGCTFCIDIAQAQAQKRDVPLEKYDALLQYETSSAFTERERAALAYVEEATRNKSVRDDTFEQVEKHFSDREIAEITWLNAMENYYNLLNRPLNIGSDELCALAE